MNHTATLTRLLSALLIATAFLLAGFHTASARAATYSVYSCKGPAGESLPNDAWLQAVSNPGQAASFTFGMGCGETFVTASPRSPYAFGDGAGLAFDAPAGTTIAAYSVERSATVQFPETGTRPALSAGLRQGDGSYTGECAAVTTDCEVSPSEVSATGLTASNLRVGVECADQGAGCAADLFTLLEATLVSARVDLTDNAAPTILSATGTLPSAKASSGIYSLDVVATDVGGGVRTVSLSIDGGKPTVHNSGGTCAEPYTLRAPCPPGNATSFPVNLGSLAPGVHAAVVYVSDAAGNVATSPPVLFSVTDPAPGSGGAAPSNGSPAVEQPVVGTDKPVIRTSSSKAVMVQGTLKTTDGTPVAGATLEVTSLDLGVYDAKVRSIGKVTSAANGSFSVSVKPNGAQRISVLFKPYATAVGTAVASTIVREELSITARRSRSRINAGAKFSISGRLEGAGAAAKGAPIEIDVNIGGRWRAVGVVEANSKGNYRWNYRFVRVTRPTRFKFRAIVRGNQAWPWPTETSSQARVLVRR